MWDSSPLLLAIMICFYIRKKTVVCFLRRKVNNLNMVNNANAYFIICKYICKLYCCMLKYETIIQTGITCKKIPFYMRDSTCRWRIVKSTKKFWSYVKNFLILGLVRNCRILIVLCKKVFIYRPIIFLDNTKQTEVIARFFFLLCKSTL